MLLRGCGTWILLSLMYFDSVLVLAQVPEPSECLQQSLAMEQSSAYLQALTALPTPPFVPVISRGEARFVSVSGLYAEVLGVSPRSIILNDIEELRFISHTLSGTPLLLVLKSAPEWTAAKSRKVVSVAKTLGLSISLLWLDDSLIPDQLAETIVETQGKSFRSNDLTRLVMQKFCQTSSP